MWTGEVHGSERDATDGLAGRAERKGLGATLIAMARAAAALHAAREAAWAQEAPVVEWDFARIALPDDAVSGAERGSLAARTIGGVELA